jgi:hypothetical protein
MEPFAQICTLTKKYKKCLVALVEIGLLSYTPNMLPSEPTNQSLELADDIAALRQRLALAREGLLPWQVDQVTHYKRPAKAGQARKANKTISPQFHVPSTRPLRLTNGQGASSFHFSHKPISKAKPKRTRKHGQAVSGAARHFGQYVEREAALARMDEPFAEVARASLPPFPISTTEEQYDESTDQADQRTSNRDLVAEFHLFESGFANHYSIEPTWSYATRTSKPDADLCLLPSGNLVCDGRQVDGVLLGAEDVSLLSRKGRYRLRLSAPGDRIDEKSLEPAKLKSAGESGRHDAYIDRSDAVAQQPDGGRALITNIDENAVERAKFWALVEQHEAVKSDDQITVRLADAPAFWSNVLSQPDCPADLYAGISKAPHSSPHKFAISSGSKVRGFLERQSGWVPLVKGRSRSGQAEPLAKFHDGRSGRVQYQIVGELPNELSAAERFSILREFAKEFEKKKLPFVAVMHAPDHSNDEKNWHFHLIYYDRPCRRITQDDIKQLAAEGYQSRHLTPGDWDFAVVTPKKGRTNGKAVPLRQNKVAAVADKSWPGFLRNRLATITNKHLKACGIDRSVDAGTYANMGIPAEPQDHLGKANAALEDRGIATPTGSSNEQRQWNAILAQADIELEQKLRDIRSQNTGATSAAEAKQPPTESIRLLSQAAQLEHQAFLLEQGLERAYSRPKEVRRKNQRLLDAGKANADILSEQQRTDAQRLVDAANAYIRGINADLGQSVWIPETIRWNAEQLRYQASEQRVPVYPSPQAERTDLHSSSSKFAETKIQSIEAAEVIHEPQQFPVKPAEPELSLVDKTRPALATTEKTVDDAAKLASMQAAMAAAGGIGF